MAAGKAFQRDERRAAPRAAYLVGLRAAAKVSPRADSTVCNWVEPLVCKKAASWALRRVVPRASTTAVALVAQRAETKACQRADSTASQMAAAKVERKAGPWDFQWVADLAYDSVEPRVCLKVALWADYLVSHWVALLAFQ